MSLADTGPLVALLDVDDDSHDLCLKIARRLPASPLTTTWPCYTEACYLLGQAGGYRYQERLWEMVRSGRLAILQFSDLEITLIRELMKTYQNVPMDLADASLVAIAESRGIARLFTLDSDFYIYRLANGSVLEIIQ